jgi:hypothetical protein
MFYHPNRPTLVPPDPLNPLDPKPDYINELEKSGKYVGEYKWNGDNTVINTDDLSFWNRDGGRLSYTPTPEVLEELRRFPKGCRLNAETMHRHTKKVKNLVLLHSVLAWKGDLMIGKTWGEARKFLEDLSWLPRTEGPCLSYDCHVLLSRAYPASDTGTFWKMFNEARAADDSIEGIVLKDPSGKLVISTRPVADVPWLLKIRKPSKKYSF